MFTARGGLGETASPESVFSVGSVGRISIVRLLKCFLTLKNNEISTLGNLEEHQGKYTGDHSE